jgi:integrase
MRCAGTWCNPTSSSWSRRRAQPTTSSGCCHLRRRTPPLQAVKGDRLEALYGSGHHHRHAPGELFGLRGADVNPTTHWLHLVKQLKTTSSRRQGLLPAAGARGLPRMRFHGLRHSRRRRCCLRWGSSEGGQRAARHRQIGITLDRYSPVTATMQQQAVSALDDLFGDQ